MKNLIRKILKESDGLEWMDDVVPIDPSEPFVGMRFKHVSQGDKIFTVVNIDDKGIRIGLNDFTGLYTYIAWSNALKRNRIRPIIQ